MARFHLAHRVDRVRRRLLDRRLRARSVLPLLIFSPILLFFSVLLFGVPWIVYALDLGLFLFFRLLVGF